MTATWRGPARGASAAPCSHWRRCVAACAARRRRRPPRRRRPAPPSPRRDTIYELCDTTSGTRGSCSTWTAPPRSSTPAAAPVDVTLRIENPDGRPGHARRADDPARGRRARRIEPTRESHSPEHAGRRHEPRAPDLRAPGRPLRRRRRVEIGDDPQHVAMVPLDRAGGERRGLRARRARRQGRGHRGDLQDHAPARRAALGPAGLVAGARRRDRARSP